jgi:predicted transcriptional regulator/REP element-mobilizing transposase RayT
MSRPHVTGGLFHVISRFHNGEYLLDHPDARCRYLEALGRGIERTDVRLFAYCLMSSHIHLVLQLGRTTLGTFTKSVNAGWVNWLNKRFKRLGTAMAHRPTSVFCDSDTYALQLVRYVHNNPVRAGIVASAEGSTWSSHRAYMGLDKPAKWLTMEPILNRFSDDPEEARQKLSTYVDEGKLEERRPEFSGSLSREMSKKIRGLVRGPVEISYPVLGPDEFIVNTFGEQEQANEDTLQFLNQPLGAMDILMAVCEELDLKTKAVLGRSRLRQLARARRLVAWLWVDRFGRQQMPIADLFGIKPAAVTQMLRKMRTEQDQRKESEIIEKIIKRIQKKIAVHQKKTAQDPAKQRDQNDSQHLLLQRRREVEQKLKT